MDDEKHDALIKTLETQNSLLEQMVAILSPIAKTVESLKMLAKFAAWIVGAGAAIMGFLEVVKRK